MTIDTKTYTLMKSIENPVLTTFSKLIDILTDPNYLLVILIGIAAYLYIVKKDKRKSIFLVASTAITSISILALKEIFQRPRPLNSIIEATSFSFPSGHATLIIFFLGILIYLFANKNLRKKSILIATPIILLVAFSRIYLQVHYLTDVLAGLVLGGLILALTIYIDKKIN
ncbi:MAG: phosphatase PAP2 family protein [Nanoarchaeota archaeon]|nr:phosphatase PAP2 family protein [Nanoarchaeota archaeon]